MSAATVQVLQDLFYVSSYVLFYLWSLLYQRWCRRRRLRWRYRGRRRFVSAALVDCRRTSQVTGTRRWSRSGRWLGMSSASSASSTLHHTSTSYDRWLLSFWCFSEGENFTAAVGFQTSNIAKDQNESVTCDPPYHKVELSNMSNVYFEAKSVNDGHKNDRPNLRGIKLQNPTTLNTLALEIHAVTLKWQ